MDSLPFHRAIVHVQPPEPNITQYVLFSRWFLNRLEERLGLRLVGFAATRPRGRRASHGERAGG